MMIDKETLEKKGTKLLRIHDQLQTFDTYAIPLEKLFYNDRNGRIATFIDEEELRKDHSRGEIKRLMEEDIARYNDFISKAIKGAEKPDSYEKTLKDIEHKGQMVAGVVLEDGRIIDGNRRFTVLRELYRKKAEQRFSTFEAVILPVPASETEQKAITLLELELQHNVDNQRGYSPIDRLVDFYKKCCDERTRTISEEEYRSYANVPAKELASLKRQTEIMLEYLEWRGQPKAFYLLKEEDLNGPLVELANAKTKFSEHNWLEFRDYFFAQITLVSGDKTRNIRNLIKLAKESPEHVRQMVKALDKEGAFLGKVDDILWKEKEGAQTPEDTHEKRKLGEDFLSLQKEAIYQKEKEKSQNSPLEKLRKAQTLCDEVRWQDIKETTGENRKEIQKILAEITCALEKIKGYF